jgi:predicted secreted Zn-dependent protease
MRSGAVISYCDSPCKAANSKSQTLDLKLGESTMLQQNQSFAIAHYDVRGSSAEELNRSLATNGPKGFHGLATWKVAYTFKMQRIENKCKIAELHLKHDGVVLMLRWVDSALTSRDLVRRWELTYASLKRHEDGHIAHGTEFMTRVRSALQASELVLSFKKCNWP